MELLERLKIRLKNYLDIDTDECINHHSLNNKGYGDIQFKDGNIHRHIMAHRAIYMIHNECLLTKDEIIMHSCDNPACCNIKHLSKGTHNDNVQDKVKKNRQAQGKQNGRYKHGMFCKDYKNSTKTFNKQKSIFKELEKDLVLSIKRDLTINNLSFEEICNLYNLEYKIVEAIATNKLYKYYKLK